MIFQRGDISEKWISSHIIGPIQKFAIEEGMDWPAIAHAAGVDPDITILSRSVPMQNCLNLFTHVALETKNDSFGFAVAQSLPVGFGSTFEYIGMSAPTLRQGLKNWVRFSPIISNCVHRTYDETDTYGILQTNLADGFYSTDQYLCVSAAWTIGCLSRIIGESLEGLVLELTVAPRTGHSRLQDILGDNLKFLQEYNRILVPKAYLDLSHDTAEPNLHAIIERKALEELSAIEQSSDELFAVTELISQALREGENTLPLVASKMGVEQRTLQRTLAAHGTSFRLMTDEVRQSLARHYLVETNLPQSEIAFLLGYSNVSTFSKSVKNWFGDPPRQYRQKQKNLSG